MKQFISSENNKRLKKMSTCKNAKDKEQQENERQREERERERANEIG